MIAYAAVVLAAWFFIRLAVDMADLFDRETW